MLIAMLLLAAPAQAQRLHDPGGDRIEMFRLTDHNAAAGAPIRHCSRDRIWCAELHYPRVGRRGRWELRVVRHATDRDPEERRWRYVLPAPLAGGEGFETGITIWSEIVRDAWGGALIGLDSSRATGKRPGFFSYQRRLQLLHIPSLAGAEPYIVLETPLSGHIAQPMCPRPAPPPGQENLPVRVLSDEEAAAIAACEDQFNLSTRFTLMPALPEADQPPDRIVATIATTSPGRRPRTPPGTQRAPIARTRDDVVRDPACTYTRSYYFDAARRRYLPDAPLPACPDFLEP